MNYFIGDPQGFHAHLPMLIRWCLGPNIAPFIFKHEQPVFLHMSNYYISLNKFCDLKVA